MAKLFRDQERALHAYNAVATVTQPEQGEYKTAVNDLAANILRSGLSAALAVIERRRAQSSRRLLEHLASAKIHGLTESTAGDLAARVRRMDADSYILATRELLKVATWLKRAAQSTFGDD